MTCANDCDTHTCMNRSVRPSTRPFIHRSDHPSIHLSIHPSVLPSARLSVHPPARPSIRPLARLSIRTPVCPSIGLSIGSSVCPSIHSFNLLLRWSLPERHITGENLMSMPFALKYVTTGLGAQNASSWVNGL